MPKLPGVAPTSPAKQQQVSRYEANAEWTGPVDLGREAMLRDLALRHGWDLVDGDRAEHQFLAWTGEEDGRFDEAVAALSPREAKGFAERTVRDVFERAKVLRESLPPSVRSAIDEGIAAYERNLFNKAAVVEDGAQLRAVRENLEAGLQAAAIPAARAIAALPADDPDKLGRFTVLKAGRFALIDSNPALPPHEKKQRKEVEATAIDTAFAEALSPQEKQDLDPEAAIETFGARIHRLAQEAQAADRAESDGLDSSATGDGLSANPEGFGGEAWLDLVRRLRPDLADGRNIVEIQALRADPKLAAEMRERGLADSARFFSRNGQEATPASLYLAHVTSRETALRLLQADPDSLAVDADPEAAPARPELFHVDGDETRPRTAGEVIALAEEAMAGTRPVDWGRQLSGASPDFLKAVTADAREAEAHAAAEAKLAAEDAYRRRLGETERAIKAGTLSHADMVRAAGEGGWIRGEDLPRLFNRLAKRFADAREYEAALSKFLNPEYDFDSNSPDDQRAVDLIYERASAGNADASDGDTEADTFLRRVVARSGIRPTHAVEVASIDPNIAQSVKVAPQFNATDQGISLAELPERLAAEGGEVADPRETAVAQLGRNGSGYGPQATGPLADSNPEDAAADAPEDIKHVVIFIGGGNDRGSEIVKDYSDSYRAATRGRGREVFYFRKGQVSQIVEAIERASRAGQRITIIGHSWGGDAAFRAASKSGKPVDNVVTIEPVGKLAQPDMARPANVANWRNVDAVPDRPNLSDAIERLGKLGAKLFGAEIPVHEADETVRITAHHEDFPTAMELGGVLDLIEKTEERSEADADPLQVVPIPLPRPARNQKLPIPRPSPLPPN